MTAANILYPAWDANRVTARAENSIAMDNFKLVFNSDFGPLGRLQGTAADAEVIMNSQWTPRYRFTHDRRGCSFDGEYQWYLDPRFDWGTGIGGLSPFSVSSGELSIVARRAPKDIEAKMPKRIDENKNETPLTHPWVSGVITTEHSFWFRYGFAEAMIKLPAGHALFPAFWMLPKETPVHPEIDIMEYIGQKPRNTNFSVHPGVNIASAGEDRDRGANMSEDWHAFGCLWTPEAFEFTIDRKVIGRVPADPIIDRFHYYLIANLAVGGAWPGPPTDNTPSPSKLQVRYIKVWQDTKLG